MVKSGLVRNTRYLGGELRSAWRVGGSWSNVRDNVSAERGRTIGSTTMVNGNFHPESG